MVMWHCGSGKLIGSAIATAFNSIFSKHSIRRTSQDSAATARPRSASFKPLPAAVEEDSFEIDEIALQAKALSARVDMLSSAPQPRISCPCCLVIDADDPSFCRQCKGHFVEVIRLQLERDSVQAVLNDEKTRLESLNAKEEMARQDAAKLSERVGELEKLMDAKAEEQARLQMDLQRMGEKIIEEIEKRAELQVSRDTLQDELEELTKSLFEEANVMVADEARKRHHHETREKTLEQELADLKVELQMEQLQLRELQIKMEESQAAAATRHRQHQQSEGSRPLSQSISLAPEDIIDPMLLMEFQDFLKHGPTVKLNKIHTLPFMKNVIDDDVTPCLRFGGNPRTSTKRLMDAILMNSCFVEEMSPSQISALQYQHQCLKEAADPGSPNAPSRSGARRASSMDPDKAGVIAAVAASMSTPTQSIFQKTVLERLSTTWSIATTSSNASNLPPSIVVDGCSTCGRIGPTRHHFKISELASDTWSPICGSCRDRLVSVCEFYNFVRHVRQGLYSTRRHEDLFQEVLSLKRKMFFSRMGAFPFLAAERSLNTRQLLRPDSQLLKDFEIASASNSPALSALPVAASGGVSESGTRAGSPGLPRVSMGAALKRINEEPSLTPAVKGGRVGSISEV
ncbi:hypothetical protein DFJ73DRAFT_848668 [Zopfochytrium polystomum]|nr:hypothetical protein DFJ73DRAFT_848668 [Zopfochytrium polystomum]